jgi:hypothetical protein
VAVASSPTVGVIRFPRTYMGGNLYDDAAPMHDAVSLHKYYDRVATRAQVAFYTLTILRIVITACIPVIALAAPQKANPVLFGSLGAAVLIMEAIVATFEPGKKWRRYRAADMAVRSEIRLYRAKAKHYAGTEDADKKMAERLDAIATAEHNDWQAIQERITATQKKSKPADNLPDSYSR